MGRSVSPCLRERTGNLHQRRDPREKGEKEEESEKEPVRGGGEKGKNSYNAQHYPATNIEGNKKVGKPRRRSRSQGENFPHPRAGKTKPKIGGNEKKGWALQRMGKVPRLGDGKVK